MPFTDEELAKIVQAEEQAKANATKEGPKEQAVNPQPPAQPAPAGDDLENVADEEETPA